MASGALSFYVNGKYAYCQYYASDDRVQLSTGLRVDAENFKAGKRTKSEAALLRRLETVIDNYEGNARQANRQTKAADVMSLLQEALGKKPTGYKSKHTFLNMFDKYVDAVKDGTITNKGKRYSESWITVASAVRTAIKDLPFAATDIAQITETSFLELTAALTTKKMFRQNTGKDATKTGASKNTVSTYIAVIIGIMNTSRRLKWHTGPLLDTQAIRTPPDNIDYEVYLSEDELGNIITLKYQAEDERYRDAFILGCQLGMRYSDLVRLTNAHRRDDLVNINTSKTGTAVWVPLNARARTIWDRYQGNFDLPAAPEFVTFIRKAAQDAGIDKQVLFRRTQGGQVVERWVQKWELLGTHTMRRSFATNAYKAGVQELSIMKVTGHKSTASFLRYIRLSDEEHATLLQQHPYFK